MNNLPYQRKYLRAPLKTNILYEEDGQIFKGQLVNISEGGMKVNYLNRPPSFSTTSVVFEVPEIPLFSALSLTSLRYFQQVGTKRDIIRATIKNNSDHYGGGAFEKILPLWREKIASYVQSYNENSVLILQLLEKSSNLTLVSSKNHLEYNEQEEFLERILLMVSLLGYTWTVSPQLYQIHKMLAADYQGFKRI